MQKMVETRKLLTKQGEKHDDFTQKATDENYSLSKFHQKPSDDNYSMSYSNK